MTFFAFRRYLGCSLLVVLSGLYVWWDHRLRTHFHPAAFYSGILLLSLTLFLTLFNSRKKLPGLRLFKASIWLQFHIYIGYFSVVIFLCHVGFRVPNGWLEGTLALFFVGVALSGVVGLVITRVFPRLLAARGENIPFEQIEAMTFQLREEVEALVQESEQKTGSASLRDAYEKNLRDYFAAPQGGLFSHLWGLSRATRRNLERLDDLKRYLIKPERAYQEQLSVLVESKEHLDANWYLQRALKYWLFVHIPLTYGLVILALGHAVLAWRFSA